MRWLLPLLLGCLAAGEPLVCRGFPAELAARALRNYGGPGLRLEVAVRERTAWFILPRLEAATAAQALAIAVGGWWAGNTLTAAPTLPDETLVVRSYPPLPATPRNAEAIAKDALAPWLAQGGGLALDVFSGAWTASLAPAGHARLLGVLSALGAPLPQAPHHVAERWPSMPFTDAVTGPDLFMWCRALAAATGWAVALAPGVEPHAAPPPPVSDTMAALAALHSVGWKAALHHGCLAIGREPTGDRQHPALRVEIAVLPAAHLAGDAAMLQRLVKALRLRVAPDAWSAPGWVLAPLFERQAVLVIADASTIHAVMAALEAWDGAGTVPD